jgi:eukaryotic-like serine/threonine-protein kinase
MNPERWRRVRQLFDEAVDLPSDRRPAFLDSLRAGEESLVREVESLLRSSDVSGDFLETPAVERFAGPTAREKARSRIGPYSVVRELGHGGMGTVYLAARSDQGFEKTVAVKLVRRGMDTDFILERFRNERRILADLDHPNIARILDGGSTEDGLPFFVMEYIPGRHLIEDCDARKLSVRERLEVFRKVCDAVAYAHRQLVVHRDLKPSNILVTPDGEPKLLDFGLARVLHPELGDEPVDRTATALRFLTPDYASPEQVRGERIATSSDIYSLGVVLYELLAGRRPYRTTGNNPDEIARAVCEQEPLRPSAAVPALKGDCDNIVLMALRKEPERRYASVEQLSDDIRRHLEGRPIHARKDTFGYRSGKFISRHKGAVAAAAAAGVLLLAAMVATIRQTRIATRERAAAEQHFNDVRQLADTFLFEFHDAIKDLPGSTPARQLVVRRGLDYLEKLSRFRSDDPELRRELAAAYERIAKVQGGLFESHLGDTRGAQQSLLKALAIRDALDRADPSRVNRAALAETELQLAEVMLVSHDSANATARSRRALSIYEGLSRSAPEDPLLKAREARALRYVGTALNYGGDRAEGIGALRSASQTFQDLLQADPRSTPYRRELAITLQQLIFALPGSGQVEEAENAYRRASSIFQELSDAEPGNFQLRRELSYTHSSMGDFRISARNRPGGLECYGRAAAILEELVAVDPRNADARLHLAETLNNIGYESALEGDRARAQESLRKSRRLFEEITAADPANLRAEVGKARMYESCGTASSDAGERRQWLEKSRGVYLGLKNRGLLDRDTTAELDAVAQKLGGAVD